MSWIFVYEQIKGILGNKEFQKRNKTANPKTQDDAIVVALYHLNREYSERASEPVRKDYGL